MERVCDTLKRFEQLAASLAACAEMPIKVYLQGELGAGKTTFVRAWLRALGVTGTVRSPTYTLVEPYTTKYGQYYHYDLYRIGSIDELEMLGFRDYLQDSCLIEWPERIQGYLPAPDLQIQIEFLADGRRVTIDAKTQVGKDVLAKAEN